MKSKSIYIFFIIAIFCILSCSKGKNYRIGVSQCSEDDWRMLMNDEMKREVMFHPEVQLEIRSANDSNDKQIADIQYFIDNGFDIIIAAPNEAEALTPVIEQAYNKKIPVLIFDRNIASDKYTAFQGADNAAIGAMAAKYAAQLLPAGGDIIEIQGLMASTPASERGRGFHEMLDSLSPNLKIVGSAPANWDYGNAIAVTDSLLALYPQTAVIFAHNDRMALGAAEAAKKRNLKLNIIGIDAAPEIGMKAVADGKIDATFLYPTEGQQLIFTALAILNGEQYERELLIPASPAVDKSNVDLLLRQNRTLNQETNHLKKLKEQVDDYWSRHSSQTALLYTFIIVFLLVCIVLFLVLRSFWQHRRHREELLEKNRELEHQRDLEKELNRQLEEATQSKLVFFTNVSHDLRTPLTLIAEPVEQVSRASNLTPQQLTMMRIADKNVKILKRLIKQILEFRKFENGKLELNLEEASPGRLAAEWAEAFKALATKKHIDFEIDIEPADTFTMALDIEKIERVVFNLLSNAFKFTPTKGIVKLSMKTSDNDKELVIAVADSGKGIPAENLDDIFSTFYQIDKVRPEGSGIGLSLAKAFIELHGGAIAVESEVGKGTVFTVTLPVTHTEKIATEAAIKESGNAAQEVAGLIPDSDTLIPDINIEDDDSKPMVLIIDDNEDVRLMIKELLKDSYRVVGAENGKTGIRLAAKYVPDAVICDVMMPGIDGFETCSAIKNEITTSHIPVLMLTACALDEQKVEGYESGADGYMSKPFNSEVLRAAVHALIANRKRIKDSTETGIASGSPQTDKKSPSLQNNDKEKEFYARFLDIVNENLGDADLNVDSLADKMGMGRSQFYRKLKALTGLSPIELLKDIRLKKSRELLLTTDKSISEIAYAVGFSTPAYFTKCYRESFSETPSALRERMS